MTRINTNVPSLVAQNRLQASNRDLQTSLTRLSTGLRINSGADDPAGLIASEALRSEITSLNKAVSNTRRASQIISTADSALGQVSSLLNDIRGLVVEAANAGALSEDEIAANQLQIDSSLQAINRIAQTTTFQGRKLLDGGLDFLTEAGTNFGSIRSLNIDQANLGPTGSLAVNVNVTTAARQAVVTVANIPTATAQARSEGSIELTRATVAAAATGSIEFSRPTAAVQATADLAVANTAGAAEFTITATSTGAYADAAGNNASFEIVQDGAQLTDIVISKSGDDVTISIRTGSNVTLDDLKTAFDADTDVQDDFDFTITAGGTEDISGATNTTAQTSLADGAAAGTVTADINLTAVATGIAANGATITLVKTNGVTTPTAVVDPANGNLTITVEDTDTVTFASIAQAINDEGTYSAVVDVTGGLANFDGDTDTDTDTPFANGAVASTLTAEITLSAQTPGATANGRTITFNQVTGTTTPLATVDGSGNITVTVNDAAAVTVSSIVDAINLEGTYEAEADTTGGLTSFNDATDTSAVNAFANGATASGGLAEAVVFELLGKTGSNVFNVSAGTSINDLVTQINLVKDATGVTASVDGQDLVLTSNDYGSDAFVDLRVISEATGGTITGAIGAGSRENGTDIVAKVNGVDASGNGNKLSINTSTLELSITVEDGSDENVSFTITGGGALFQLGADVVSNQQARIGIASVSAARLGGAAGKLFQLGSGESASLVNDPNTAARIVTEAINQVTSLRGRLGAFQATTLESNITSLSDTVANLQEAESTIRDADFAKESAALTRAQILVQSGTNVLALANQNPQNVLSLLR